MRSQRSAGGRLVLWMAGLAGVAVLLWAAAVGGMWVMRHELIYPFRDWPRADKVAGLPGARAEEVLASDGVPVTVWVTPPRPGRAVVLHFMGNAGSIQSAALRLAEFAHAGFGVVVMNYRGAGGTPGEPTRGAIVQDALAVYDALPDLVALEGPPVIYGTSLGAAVAVQTAARRPTAALVLGAPFARLCETARHHYPWVPACLILRDEDWDSARRIGTIDAPILVLHGDADQVIPVEQARKLFAAASEPKRLVVYPGGRHSDLRLHGSGIETIAFLEALGL